MPFDPAVVATLADEITVRSKTIYEMAAVPVPDPEPPETVVNTSQALTDALAVGGRIRLSPGEYQGNFVVGVNNTEILGINLPPERVPSGATFGYALIPGNQYQPALSIRANNVRCEGFRVKQGMVDRAVVAVGRDLALKPEDQPDLVVFDRVELDTEGGTGKRGFQVHSRGFALYRSRSVGFIYKGADSQSFFACNGPGPYLLEDNELSGSGENILFGGATITDESMLPSQISIRKNLIVKPAEWRTITGTVKNSIELKAARGALIEENEIVGSWKDAQNGSMIVLTPRNQDGKSPFVVVEDVVIRRNRSRNHTSGYAVNMLLTDYNHISGLLSRVTIEYNLFEDSPNGFLVNNGVAEYLKINQNTNPRNKYNWLALSETMLLTSLTADRNVFATGQYGIGGQGTALGAPSLDAHTSLQSFSENVIEKCSVSTRVINYPAGNTLVKYGELAGLLSGPPDYTWMADPEIGY